MRLVSIALIVALIMAVASTIARAASEEDVQRVVAQEWQAIKVANGAGGMAVAVRIDGRTLFFNSGWADLADLRPVTADSLFNLASIRKAFEGTLLAQIFQRGEFAFDDPVASYVTELQQARPARPDAAGFWSPYLARASAIRARCNCLSVQRVHKKL